MSMQDIDKLVFALVPMTLAGPRARRKLHEWRGLARPLAFPRLAAIYLRRDGKVWEVVPARY
jgi:hypothetical protein